MANEEIAAFINGVPALDFVSAPDSGGCGKPKCPCCTRSCPHCAGTGRVRRGGWNPWWNPWPLSPCYPEPVYPYWRAGTGTGNLPDGNVACAT